MFYAASKLDSPWEGWNTPDTNLCSQHNMPRQLAGAGLPSQGEKRHFITHKHGLVPLPWQVYWLAWGHLTACVWCSSAAIFEWFISKLFLKVRPDVNMYLFESTWLKKKAQRQHIPYRWKRWELKSLSKEQTPWRAVTLPAEHTQCFPLCFSVTRRWSCSKQARPLCLCLPYVPPWQQCSTHGPRWRTCRWMNQT